MASRAPDRIADREQDARAFARASRNAALLLFAAAAIFALLVVVVPWRSAPWLMGAAGVALDLSLIGAAVWLLFCFLGEWLQSGARQPWGASLTLAILFCLPVALAMAFALENVERVSLGWRSTAWPSVPGTILDFTIEPLTDRRGRLVARRVVTNYSYTVAGAHYQASQYAAADTFPLSEPLPALRPGDTCSVCFDPADPNYALLARGVQTKSVENVLGYSTVAIMVGVLVSLLTFAAMGGFKRWARKRQYRRQRACRSHRDMLPVGR